MNDLKPFNHGQEGTHYACDVALKEGNTCCGCTKHDCPEQGAQGYMKTEKTSDQVWDDAVTANRMMLEKQIYQKGFGDGHKDAREYMKKLIKDEIWTHHELYPDFLKEHKVGIEKAINELCMKSHNEVLEKLIELL